MAHPDLQIHVRIHSSGDHGSLSFEVQGLGVLRKDFGPVPLVSPVATRVKELFEDLERQASEKSPKAAQQKLRAKGRSLAKELLPQGLQDLLVRHQSELRTIQILSDDPHIPWELAWIPGLKTSDGPRSGAFLCEAFALARWLPSFDSQLYLPSRRLGLVVPKDSGLPAAGRESAKALNLEQEGRQVELVPATVEGVLDALGSGRFDGLHVAGHGTGREDNPDRHNLSLEKELLTPEDLLEAGAGLAQSHPLIFLNGCETGRSGYSWTRPGGWGHQLVGLGAGAFLGTLWSVRDSKAHAFAAAFYRHFLAGHPIAEAVRLARLDLAKEFPGDPTRLAYVLFAHALASCKENPLALPDPARELLRTEVQLWDPELSSPAALLRAEYGIVPFHGRNKEQDDLRAWAQQDQRLSVRLFTGPGGMGKTRLALETALELQKDGWRAGFVAESSPLSAEELWSKVARPDGKLLLVIDYAETRRPFLVPLLRLLRTVKAGPLRVMLLARAALDWWDQLKSEGEGVGELLAGPATSRIPLKAVAQSLSERKESYRLAGEAFALKLGTQWSGQEPEKLEAPYFERVLLLHMAALGAVGGGEVDSEDKVLDYILDRERRFWRKQAEARRIPTSLAQGIGRAFAVLTLRGGAQDQADAVEAIRQLQIFEGQTGDRLVTIGRLLHDLYPGERWIHPLQPDLLGEHLVMRELEKDGEELLDLTLGPAETSPSKDASASPA